MSDLLTRIVVDSQLAMKARDGARVEVLRLIIAAVKNYEIDTYPPSRSSGEASPPGLTDEDVVSVLQKLAKRHRESIEGFTKGNRSDLVAKEKQQLAVVEEFLPKGLGEDEIRTIVSQVVAQEKDFGRAMGMVMGKVKGKADGTMVSAIVKEMLQK